jgi:hypothetical protein
MRRRRAGVADSIIVIVFHIMIAEYLTRSRRGE